MNTGIYEIKNILNNKRYIGSAVNLTSRFYMHKYDLKKGKHKNRHLQNAWDKYGADNFKFSPILYCDKENLLFYEQRAIDVYKATEDGVYNICPIAGNSLGVKRSEETRKKISIANKGYRHTKEAKEKISIAGKGNNNNKGKKFSEEWKGNISKGLKAHYSEGFHSAMLGKHHTEEAKQKVSDKLKGSVFSDEHRRKLSISATGRHHTLETKEKLRDIVKQEWKAGIYANRKPRGSKNESISK